MIRVGNVNKFALECIASDNDYNEGKVYIVIKGERYGSKYDEFELNHFFKNIKTPLSVFNPYFPDLYHCTAEEIFQSLDAVWQDTSVADCPIESIVPGFFDDPSDVMHQIIFYGGDYAFDGISIVLVSNEKEIHLMVRGKDSVKISDVKIGINEFNENFFTLCDLWKIGINDTK